MIGTQCVGLIIRHECCHPRKKRYLLPRKLAKFTCHCCYPMKWYDVIQHTHDLLAGDWRLCSHPLPSFALFFSTRCSNATPPSDTSKKHKNVHSTSKPVPKRMYSVWCLCMPGNPAFCLPSDLSSSGKNVHISNHEFLHMMLSRRR